MFDCWADPVATSIKDLHAQAVGSVGQVILGNPDTFLLKNEPTPASFRFFGLSKQASIQFVNVKINVQNVNPSIIWRRDSNPRPFEHESTPIITRPGLLPNRYLFVIERIRKSTY